MTSREFMRGYQGGDFFADCDPNTAKEVLEEVSLTDERGMGTLARYEYLISGVGDQPADEVRLGPNGEEPVPETDVDIFFQVD